MKNPTKNLAASLQGQLKRRAAETGRRYNEVLDYYAMEKFLARLVASPHADKFVLKGGLLFHVWQYPLRRPTRDIDLQASTENSVEHITALFKEVCRQVIPPDGLEFDPNLISGQAINLQAARQGVRVRCQANFTDTRVRVIFNVDVSFANIITPVEVERLYPPLLPEAQVFSLYTYPRETAVAEKLEAIVKLGVTTSRLNDFYDLYVLATYSDFQGAVLALAIQATFFNRTTTLPSATPAALEAGFADREQPQWTAYLNEFDQAHSEVGNFNQVLERLRAFLLPPLHAAAADAPFTRRWPAGGPWQA